MRRRTTERLLRMMRFAYDRHVAAREEYQRTFWIRVSSLLCRMVIKG